MPVWPAHHPEHIIALPFDHARHIRAILATYVEGQHDHMIALLVDARRVLLGICHPCSQIGI